MKTIYTVFSTTNEWGAKGKMVASFTSEEEAQEVVNGAGWYGGKGILEEGMIFETAEEFYQMQQERKALRRQRAELLKENNSTRNLVNKNTLFILTNLGECNGII